MNIISFPTILILLSLHGSWAFHPANHPALAPDRFKSRPMSQTSANESLSNQLSRYQERDPIPNDNIFFIELGFGNDSHGQSSTKAAVRACRNSIEFNSIPSIQRLIPDGGYEKLKLDVLLAVPSKYQSDLNLEEVAKVFPYGDVRFDLQDGGMVAKSGIAIEKMGDVGDDMVVVCASVTVGR